MGDLNKTTAMMCNYASYIGPIVVFGMIIGVTRSDNYRLSEVRRRRSDIIY